MKQEMGNIVMSNGVVLKDGLSSFKADEKLVEKSLSYIAKISKGLYSGVLNSDPEFSKFQKKAIQKLIEQQKEDICKKVVLGAEEQLKRISTSCLAAQASDFLYAGRRRRTSDVQEIDLGEGNDDTGIKMVATVNLIENEGNRLASMGQKELKKIVEATEEAKEIRKIAASRMKKKMSKKKKTKKKAVRKKNEK